MSRPEQWTWGGFLEYAEPFGVTVETLPNIRRSDGTTGPIEYLERAARGMVLTHYLPTGFSPERRLGPLMLEKVCRTLDIPKPDWPESQWRRMVGLEPGE
jgi:hypothetical protein